MIGRGRPRGDSRALAIVRARLTCPFDDPDGLLPTLAMLRAWFDGLAVDGETEDGDAAVATDGAVGSGEGGDDDDGGAAALALALALPGRRCHADSVRVLLDRVCAHVDQELEATSPPLAAAARALLAHVVDDAVAEVGERGVTLRCWHDNAFGCVAEALYKLTRD